MSDFFERGVVVTLVPGTWAGKAAWTEPNSPLRDRLAAQLGQDVVFVPFKWSGRNSHKARLAAARSLEGRILDVRSQYPAHCHIVVAHSHGGNIALYALRNPEVAASISGLVTLATPFIYATPRHVERALQILMAALNLGTFLSAMIVIFGTLLVFLRPFPELLPTFHGGSAIIAALVFFAGGLWLNSYIWRLSSQLVAVIRESLLTWAADKQLRVVNQLSVAACETVPVLSIGFSFDEAGFVLRLTRVLAETAPRLAQFFSAATVWLFTVGSWLLLLGVVISILRFVGWSLLPHYEIVWSLTLLAFILSLQGFVFFEIASAVLPLVARSVGFGPESPLSAMLVRLSATDELLGRNVEQKRYSLKDAYAARREDTAARSFLFPSLVHSLAYAYPVALRELGEWITYVRRTASPPIVD
jgi:pimeloyl-ACP methyl ester carboxylesterase